MSASDDALLEKPVIIVGSARSGTDFLAHILRQQGNFAFANEPRLTWRWGNDGKSDMLRPEDARPDVIAMIRSKFAKVVREQGAKRLIETTPSNSLRPAFVHRVFPDARLIHIMRRGADTALSLRRYYLANFAGVNPVGDREVSGSIFASPLIGRLREASPRQIPYYATEVLRRIAPKLVGPASLGQRLPGQSAMQRELPPLKVAFWQWRAAVEESTHYGRKIGPALFRECRLEELTPDVITSLLEFCELEGRDAALAFLAKEYDPSRPGAPSRSADPEELAEVEAWVEPTMRWLGYD